MLQLELREYQYGFEIPGDSYYEFPEHVLIRDNANMSHYYWLSSEGMLDNTYDNKVINSTDIINVWSIFCAETIENEHKHSFKTITGTFSSFSLFEVFGSHILLVLV